MLSIDEREKNLFRATDAMAQFYDEIESLLGILRDRMEEAGFGSVGRLRAGTFSYRNLTRRLLATATTMYVKGGADLAIDEEEDEAAEDEEEEEDEAVERKTIPIGASLRIPFTAVWLFPPRAFPSVRNLKSPQMLIGALGNFTFLDKKTRQSATPERSELALSNIAQFNPKRGSAVGEHIAIKCWRPKEMKKYKLDAEIVAFEECRLFDVDSQEKIRSIADKLSGFQTS